MLGINWTTWVAIGAGSAFGGILRQLLTEVVTRVVGPGFPWGTLPVNVSGSAAMGFVVAIVAGGMPAAWSVTAQHFVMTGVLRGLTTFSSFSVQTLALMQQGHWQAAAPEYGLFPDSVCRGLLGRVRPLPSRLRADDAVHGFGVSSAMRL